MYIYIYHICMNNYEHQIYIYLYWVLPKHCNSGSWSLVREFSSTGTYQLPIVTRFWQPSMHKQTYVRCSHWVWATKFTLGCWNLTWAYLVLHWIGRTWFMEQITAQSDLNSTFQQLLVPFFTEFLKKIHYAGWLKFLWIHRNQFAVCSKPHSLDLRRYLSYRPTREFLLGSRHAKSSSSSSSSSKSYSKSIQPHFVVCFHP